MPLVIGDIRWNQPAGERGGALVTLRGPGLQAICLVYIYDRQIRRGIDEPFGLECNDLWNKSRQQTGRWIDSCGAPKRKGRN